MKVIFEDWPFRSLNQRSKELNERWWNECYVEGAIDTALKGQRQWHILYGAAGCGRTTALAALRRWEEEFSLIVEYPSTYWYGSRHAIYADGNHLGQLMARAALGLSQELHKHPHKLKELSPFSADYLH